MECGGAGSKMEEDCTTPKRRECRIPEANMCPPPPKKKAAGEKKREPPKNGYFQPPDLDALFALPPRTQSLSVASSIC